MRRLVFAAVCVLLAADRLAAQSAVVPSPRAGRRGGAEIYQQGCAACHGADGKGVSLDVRGFEKELPDFTDCRLTTPEPLADWFAVVHEGGPIRGLDRHMPAFGDALTAEEIENVGGDINAATSNETTSYYARMLKEDVPLALDFIKGEEDRQVMEAFLAQTAVARPVLAPPGIPDDRVKALRAAFMATAMDPEFIQDAERARIEVSPTSAVEGERVLAYIGRIPPKVMQRLKEAIAPPTR